MADGRIMISKNVQVLIFLHTGDIIISDDVTLHNERAFVDIIKVDNVEMERVF